MTAVLEARGLGRTLASQPPVLLVRQASFDIAPGTFTAITGPSGCGKSSLLYLLGMLDRPTEGQLLVDGRDMTGLNGDARARVRLERFGFVFQFHFLLPELTALENVMLPMRRLGRLTGAEIRDRAGVLLGDLGLREKAARHPGQLSGGERQRIAIARALANDPAVILADEPTGSLDSANSMRVLATLHGLARDQGRAVVCVTHDGAIAAEADARIQMLDGAVVSIG